MKCQQCQQELAQVHVTELADQPPQVLGDGQLPVWAFEEQHLCESCASTIGVPFAQAKKTQLEIWKLLHATAKRQRRDAGLACPDCGMTLAEFREKGRLGCPRDYEVFRDHLDRLLERVHNGDHHIGRLPGGERIEPQDPTEPARAEQSGPESEQPAEVEEDSRERLSAELEQAVRDEDYERAAQLRDAIQALES